MKKPAKRLKQAQNMINSNPSVRKLMTAVGARVCAGLDDKPVVMVGDKQIYVMDQLGISRGWSERLQSKLKDEPVVVPLKSTEELNTLVHRCLVESVAELYSNMPKVHSEIQYGWVEFSLTFTSPVAFSACYETDIITDLDADALKAQFRSVLAKPAQGAAHDGEQLAQAALESVRAEVEYMGTYQQLAKLPKDQIEMFSYKKELKLFMTLIDTSKPRAAGNIKLSSVRFCMHTLTFSLKKVDFSVDVEREYTTLDLKHMTSIRAFLEHIEFINEWNNRVKEVVARYPGVELKTSILGHWVEYTLLVNGEAVDAIRVRYFSEVRTDEKILDDIESVCQGAQRIVDAMLARIDALDPKSELLYCCIMRAVTGRLSNFHDTWPVMQVVKALRGLSFSGSYREPANIVGSCKLLKEDEILHAVSDLEAAELLRLEWKHIHKYNTSYCTVGLSDACSTFPPAKDRANALANFRPTHFGNTDDMTSYTSLDWAVFVDDQAALAESGGSPDWERLLPLVEDRMVLGYCMDAFSAIFHTAPEPIKDYLTALVKMLPAGAYKNTVSKLAKA